MVKFVGMSGVVHVNCPNCIAVDASDAILKVCSVTGRSDMGVTSSVNAALHIITFVFGSSFAVPFFNDEPLERLLAHVVFKLSIECERAVVSMAR
eukprot:14872033-Ditylum_brightwellii.AAC.1